MLFHDRRKRRRSSWLSRRGNIIHPRDRRLAAERLEDRRLLATFMVSNLNNAGAGSLRDAIAVANAMSGPDEIQFSVTGTIQLQSQLPTITGPVNINGPGATLLRLNAGDGADNAFGTGDGYRIFNIDDGNAAQIAVTISGLTLTGGDAARGSNARVGVPSPNPATPGQPGGAIRSAENLTLSGVTLTGNSAGNGGNGNSTFGNDGASGGSGGAVYSTGDLTIHSSSFSNNRSGRGGNAVAGASGDTAGSGGAGGAIYSQRAVTVTNSEFISNFTSPDGLNGSRISTSGPVGGGAIYGADVVEVSGSAVINNSTVGMGAAGGGVRSIGATTISRSTISGNSTAGSSAGGGGVFSFGAPTISYSTVSDNSTAGNVAGGGGVRSLGAPTISHSTISGNSTAGLDADGGGVRSVGATISHSTISDNFAAGNNSEGGGVFSFGATTISHSTISGNSTAGDNVGGYAGNNATGGGATGGGVFSFGATTISHSTISGNSTAGSEAGGGGVYSLGATTINHSTFSGNFTAGSEAGGGGVLSFRATTISHSTISGNSTVGSSALGGGVNSRGPLTLFDSIVLGNIATQTSGDDVFEQVAANVGGDGVPSYLGLNIVGTGSDTNGADGRINASSAAVFAASVPTLVDYNGDGTPETPTGVFGGALADNGGAVPTIALRDNPTNPALDAGDASLLAEATFSIDFNGDGDTSDTVTTDARGLARNIDLPGIGTAATVDLGAFEVQLAVVSADFDNDGDVDGRDFLIWQRGVGKPMAAKSDGDADGDQDVDADDLNIWRDSYATPTSALAAASVELQQPAAHNARLFDAALAWLARANDLPEDEPEFAFEPAAWETALTVGSEPSWPAPAIRATPNRKPATADREAETSDDPSWLADELLTSFFP
jgi:hypothetical protein